MKRWKLMLAAQVALLGVVQAASAEDRPAPRSPIGPPQSLEMLPIPSDPFSLKSGAIPANAIRILNRGDRRLNVSYWDDVSAWQAKALEAGINTDITCASCAGSLVVIYHDGTTTQRVSLKSGSGYVMGWSPQRNAWLLAPPDTK